MTLQGRIRLTGDANTAAVGAGTAVRTGYRGLVTVRVALAAGAFAAGVGRGAAVLAGFGSNVAVRIGLAGRALAAAVGAGAAVRTGISKLRRSPGFRLRSGICPGSPTTISSSRMGAKRRFGCDSCRCRQLHICLSNR